MKHAFNLKILSALMLVLCVALASACSPEKNKETGLRQVTDAEGTIVAVREKPQRIVSLGISVDDALIELVAPTRIAAVTYLEDDPGISNITEKAKQVEKRASANLESVLALKPDLVIIPNWQPKELTQSMRDMSIPVYVCLAAENIAQVKTNIREIADVVGEAEQGERLIAQMDAVLKEVAEKVKLIPEDERLTVVRFSTMGAGTSRSFEEICRHAGVKNGAALAGLKRNQMMSKEQIIMVNPDFFLLPTWDYTQQMNLDQYKKELEDDPAFQKVKAVQNKRLYHVPDRYLYATSQNIVIAVREVAKAAYPHLFE